jgi:hypothetical protein
MKFRRMGRVITVAGKHGRIAAIPQLFVEQGSGGGLCGIGRSEFSDIKV